MSDDIVFNRDQVELSADSKGNLWGNITMTPEQAAKLASKLPPPANPTYSVTHKAFDKPLGGHQPLTFRPLREDSTAPMVRFRVAWDCKTGWVVSAVNESDRYNGFVGPIKLTFEEIATLGCKPCQDYIKTKGATYGIHPDEIEVI